jgi:hypothetical protein
MIPKHKIFISYHHKNDQYYKNELSNIALTYDVFEDASVDTGGISDELTDQQIRTKIRDEYLKDSSVTIVLVGTETKYRKHVDWEIYSSMYNGAKNKKSGILVINLPSINGSQISICDEDKHILGPELKWSPITNYGRYDYLPSRVFDNLKCSEVNISIVDYSRIINNPEGLKQLIDIAYQKRDSNQYDLSKPMRRRNS